MITKSKIFTFLAALFLICLVFSPASGDFASVKLAILDGKITLTQTEDGNVKVEGRIKMVSPGEVNQLIGLDLLILHKIEVLDSGTIMIPT
ncbi:11185_t:CDS:2 [Diversispora eburnea]|uniref:11185_t:CDS:1 n=1 Tax=Diversispora eburnea TaxID=1213867 RepID=A0A9N9EX74_9GLOM|nr:11185_t:CDS:2 [Diversispora eburnea]